MSQITGRQGTLIYGIIAIGIGLFILAALTSEWRSMMDKNEAILAAFFIVAGVGLVMWPRIRKALARLRKDPQ